MKSLTVMLLILKLLCSAQEKITTHTINKHHNTTETFRNMSAISYAIPLRWRTTRFAGINSAQKISVQHLYFHVFILLDIFSWYVLYLAQIRHAIMTSLDEQLKIRKIFELYQKWLTDRELRRTFGEQQLQICLNRLRHQ